MRAVWAILAILLFAATPTVSAQRPVDSCSEQCAPQDPDVNDPPLRSQGPANVILYGHFEDILNMAPMNTVPPDPIHEPDLRRGFLMPTIDTNSGVCAAATTCADFHFKNSQFSMIFCSGTVEFRPEGWYHGCHSPAPHVRIELVGDAVFYFYLSADSTPDQMSGNAPPGPTVMPMVRVSAALRHGYPEAKTVAYGVSETADLVSLPGEEQVYEFRVAMRPVATLPERPDAWSVGGTDQAFLSLNAKIEQIEISDEPGTSVSQPDWRMRTGARFPPRVILPVIEPLLRNGVDTTAVDGTAFVRLSVRSGFGSYDVDPEQFGARIIRRDGAVASDEALVLIDVVRRTDHDGVQKPVSFVWRIHPEHINGSAADHEIEVWARNLQGTYEIRQRIPMPIAAFEGDAALPGFGWLGFGLAAALTVVTRRRLDK